MKERDFSEENNIPCDDLLYKRLKNKDHEALKEFYFEVQPQIFYFLFRLTSNKSIAEELTQEAFVKLWQAIDRIDPHKSVKAYLFKIARNLAINEMTRMKPTVEYEDENFLVQYSQKLNNDIDHLFLLDDFQKAINTLPERCKTTFLLNRISGFDYCEIGEIMNVSLQTVKNQMSKALSVLRSRLSRYVK